MTYQIVVCLYKEDISWTQCFHEKDLFIYNHSDDGRFITRPNVGREGSVFLEHILIHYDKLPEYLVLLQGNPFDHMFGIDDTLRVNIENILATQPLSITPMLCHWYYESCYDWNGLRPKEYFQLFFDNDPMLSNNQVEFAAGSQYVIPRRCVLLRKKTVYKHIHFMILLGYMITLAQEANGLNPSFDMHANYNGWKGINGWAFERIISYLFRDDIPVSPLLNAPRYLVIGGCGKDGRQLVDRLSVDHLITVLDIEPDEHVFINHIDHIILWNGDALVINIRDVLGYFDGVFNMTELSTIDNVRSYCNTCEPPIPFINKCEFDSDMIENCIHKMNGYA